MNLYNLCNHGGWKNCAITREGKMCPIKFVQSVRNPVHLHICHAIIAHWLCTNNDDAVASRTNWMFWRRMHILSPQCMHVNWNCTFFLSQWDVTFSMVHNMWSCHGQIECFGRWLDKCASHSILYALQIWYFLKLELPAGFYKLLLNAFHDNHILVDSNLNQVHKYALQM